MFFQSFCQGYSTKVHRTHANSESGIISWYPHIDPAAVETNRTQFHFHPFGCYQWSECGLLCRLWPPQTEGHARIKGIQEYLRKCQQHAYGAFSGVAGYSVGETTGNRKCHSTRFPMISINENVLTLIYCLDSNSPAHCLWLEHFCLAALATTRPFAKLEAKMIAIRSKQRIWHRSEACVSFSGG